MICGRQWALAFALIVMSASTAHALSGRTFLATTESDANACSAAAPCRTLNAALAATTDNGTIIITDSGGYGTNQTIAKSIKIISDPGVTAEFIGSGGYAITVDGLNVGNNSVGSSGTGTLAGFTLVSPR